MQRNQLGLVILLALLPGLNACQPQNQNSSQDDALGETASVSTPPEPTELALEPASLPTCNDTEVTVKWDVQTEHPDVTDIEIWVGYGADIKLWLHSAVQGESKTGQWTHPGAVFVIKDKANGTELARTVMQGPTCD